MPSVTFEAVRLVRLARQRLTMKERGLEAKIQQLKTACILIQRAIELLEGVLIAPPKKTRRKSNPDAFTDP